MTYQDDVMRIARELAGYTMGEADLLRRAMGKKIPSEMIPHREKFMKGAGERGIIRDPSPNRFSSRRKNSPAMASTRAMPPPMPRSPTRPRF